MAITKRFVRLVKTISELGFKKSAYFGTYLLAKRSGFYAYKKNVPAFPYHDFEEPDWICTFYADKEKLLQTLNANEREQIIVSADEIVNGQMLAFGMIPQSIVFDNQRSANHWSKISDAFADGDDIKLHWESARFSWVFPLIQAYHLKGEQKYFDAFKKYFIDFCNNNPYPLGIHWLSAQEVSLRMIAIICAYSIFSDLIHDDQAFRKQILEQIWLHAHRIPQTLIYARAQNNNHLLSDALGMIYAGAFFDTLSIGKKWLENGWGIFNETLQSQIQPNGTYVQQSMNYHRLMLSECLWAKKIADIKSLDLPTASILAIQNATDWLGQFIQQENGQVPNLGHNDGSLIFPISNPDYSDYLGIYQTCKYLFTPQANIKNTAIINWLNINSLANPPVVDTPNLPVIKKEDLFVYMRAESFAERPAHADQNHVDIWANGENIAMDAGTYRYTHLEPWNNSLAHTISHNTITINDEDQMIWAGRFRWLDWSTGNYIKEECSDNQITAIHNGYIRYGIVHKRKVKYIDQNNIEIIDQLIPQKKISTVSLCRLHWLLPDGSFKNNADSFDLQTTRNNISLSVNLMSDQKPILIDYAIIRCGQIMYGKLNTDIPTLGWTSPTYQAKLPALSYLATIENPQLPLDIYSHWEIK